MEISVGRYLYVAMLNYIHIFAKIHLSGASFSKISFGSNSQNKNQIHYPFQEITVLPNSKHFSQIYLLRTANFFSFRTQKINTPCIYWRQIPATRTHVDNTILLSLA